MTDAAALRAIHDGFAVPVVWTQDELSVPVGAVVFHDPGDDPMGMGKSVRRRGYEVMADALPFAPRNGDMIVEGARIWRVMDVTDYEEALAWRVMVERWEART